MIRKLVVLTVFSVSTLFVTSMVCAGGFGIAGGVLPQTESNNKLLINPVVSTNQVAFKQEMTDLPKIIVKNDIMSLLHDSRAVNSSA